MFNDITIEYTDVNGNKIIVEFIIENGVEVMLGLHVLGLGKRITYYDPDGNITWSKEWGFLYEIGKYDNEWDTIIEWDEDYEINYVFSDFPNMPSEGDNGNIYIVYDYDETYLDMNMDGIPDIEE